MIRLELNLLGIRGARMNDMLAVLKCSAMGASTLALPRVFRWQVLARRIRGVA